MSHSSPFPNPPSAPAVGPVELADRLGIASAALGLPMLAAPSRFPCWIGIESDRTSTALTVFVGLRELSATQTINLMRHRRIGAWARVAGDTMDLLMLGRSFLTRRQSTPRLLGAIAFVAGIGAVDLYTAIQLGRAEGVGIKDGSQSEGTGMTVPPELTMYSAITVGKPVEEVERAFAEFSWSSFDPAGAEVRFTPAPGDRGTEVHVKVCGRRRAMNDELRRFKALLETGVEPRSDKTPEGFSTPRQFAQRPAQPVGGAVA